MRAKRSHRQLEHHLQPGAVTVSGNPDIGTPPGTLETVARKTEIRKTTLFACLTMAVLCVVVGGCAFSVTPGKQGGQAEWIGNYQKEQAAEKDQDRATALRIRTALAGDPVLRKLDLNVFVDRGTVRLCGSYPDPNTRARAVAVVEQIKGVESVTTRCDQ